MDTQTMLLVGAAVLAVLLLIGLVLLLRKRSRDRQRQEELQRRYGPEYERTVAATGSKKKAVAELTEREERREDLTLHDLDEQDLHLVRERLAALQYRFLDDPPDALLGLSRVVREVLRARGYPIGDDREEGLQLFAVDYPQQAQSIRDLLEDHHDDVTEARLVFLRARDALRESAGVEYHLSDATSRSEAPSSELDPAGPAGNHAGPAGRTAAAPTRDPDTEVVDVVDDGEPARTPAGTDQTGAPEAGTEAVDVTDEPAGSSRVSTNGPGDDGSRSGR